MPGINEELFDAANRHQIYLIRFGGSSAKAAIKLLKKAEKELAGRLQELVSKAGPIMKDPVTINNSRRLKALLSDIRQQNRDLHAALGKAVSGDLKELAVYEVDLADRRLTEAAGMNLNNFRPSPETLRTLVDDTGVRGIALKKWFKKLEADRFHRLEGVVKLGLIEGDTTQQLLERLAAAEQIGYRQAETLVRTHVNHVANSARGKFYEANADIMAGERWTSTLDGRTSSICQARDGKVYPISQGPRPPAHPNCRSIMTPITKSWDELAEPGTFKKGRGADNIDALFKKNLKAQGLLPEEIKNIKRSTRASMTGQVPDKMTYQDWLKRQPEKFQKDVLGKTRAKLFKEGGLPLDRFVETRTGRSFSLDELKRKNEAAFMAAKKAGAL